MIVSKDLYHGPRTFQGSVYYHRALLEMLIRGCSVRLLQDRTAFGSLEGLYFFRSRDEFRSVPWRTRAHVTSSLDPFHWNSLPTRAVWRSISLQPRSSFIAHPSCREVNRNSTRTTPAISYSRHRGFGSLVSDLVSTLGLPLSSSSLHWSQ